MLISIPGILYHSNPGIDFLALARPSTHTTKLVSRATMEFTPLGIFLIVLGAIIGIGLLFCGVVGCIMLKNVHQKHKRERKFQQLKPTVQHQYQALEDMETTGVHEMPPDNQIRDTVPYQRAQLESGFNEVPRVAQLDGFTAAFRDGHVHRRGRELMRYYFGIVVASTVGPVHPGPALV
ncbi:hypothetical protein BDV95DRAFT_595918 [Massariosphaeria phaeospora]|uniref:Uncharacterized protein n=1 Tax=Massariosphaeria phaeospora TaxID=100035 RepID=A0A7C8I964_9PLEO|nr:hypothetical protein BDV95DRAFT_595918 [Massariosphaeria phaeospora]